LRFQTLFQVTQANEAGVCEWMGCSAYLADFHFLLPHGAHNKSWDEHNATSRYDFKIRNFNLQFLVVE